MDYKNTRKTICWDCDNAVGRCSWSHDFTPVEGWVALPTTVGLSQGKGKNTTNSYLVLQCPLFVRDKERYNESLGD